MLLVDPHRLARSSLVGMNAPMQRCRKEGSTNTSEPPCDRCSTTTANLTHGILPREMEAPGDWPAWDAYLVEVYGELPRYPVRLERFAWFYRCRSAAFLKPTDHSLALKLFAGTRHPSSTERCNFVHALLPRSCNAQYIDGSSADVCSSAREDVHRRSVYFRLEHHRNEMSRWCTTPRAPIPNLVPISWQRYGATGYHMPNNYAPVCSDGRREAYVGVDCRGERACPGWHLAPYGFWQWPTAIGLHDKQAIRDGSWAEVIRFQESLEVASYTTNLNSTWWYAASGSGTWLNVGRTCVDVMGCSPPKKHQLRGRHQWMKWARSQGYDTVQFVVPTALHGHEIVDLRVASARVCDAAKLLRGGVAADRPCHCQNDHTWPVTRCLNNLQPASSVLGADVRVG